MRRTLGFALLLLLAGCATGHDDHLTYLAGRGLEAPKVERFPHCRGYGCRITDYLSLTDTEWAEVESFFTPVASAEAERAAIARAIATFETIIGSKNGTVSERAGTYIRLGDTQHDCHDESINTTIYLDLLAQKKLLRFHDVGTPQGRFPILARGLGPHQTAVITDKASSERYAVDSWFHDNGAPAEVVPFKAWFYGWRPD